jgi:mRNA deadenylase 3'-5' endonuclease subunit Ccr4
MKYIKKYESEQQYREVDLQQLWDDMFTNYYSKLFDRPVYNDIYFHSFLKKILLTKDIEMTTSVGGSIIYGRAGKVEEVIFNDYTLIKIVKVKLYNTQKLPLKRARSTEHIIARIANNSGYKIKIPQIVKIYNSEPLEIENKIEFLRNTNKYNI